MPPWIFLSFYVINRLICDRNSEWPKQNIYIQIVVELFSDLRERCSNELARNPIMVGGHTDANGRPIPVQVDKTIGHHRQRVCKITSGPLRN